MIGKYFEKLHIKTKSASNNVPLYKIDSIWRTLDIAIKFAQNLADYFSGKAE